MTDPFDLAPDRGPMMAVREDGHTIVFFRTESGSSYELDTACRRVRRLAGTYEPTTRQGPDGDWKDYISVSTPVLLGEPVTVCWSVDAARAVARGTRTSPVVEVSVVPGCCGR